MDTRADVISKLASASSPEEVESVLSECGFELSEGEKTDEDTGESPMPKAKPKGYANDKADILARFGGEK